MELDLKPELLADAAAVSLDVGERLAAVDLGLALAEQVEIGSVQDDDDRIHAAPPESRHREERSNAAIQDAAGRATFPGLLRLTLAMTATVRPRCNLL